MCTKKAFTKKEANGALNYNRHNRGRKSFRKECRAYHCPDCNMWHLTKQPRNA